MRFFDTYENGALNVHHACDRSALGHVLHKEVSIRQRMCREYTCSSPESPLAWYEDSGLDL